MKILVTGGTGFIGSHLIDRLVEDGFSVRALVRPSSDTQRLGCLGVEIVRGDILDPAVMDQAAQGCGRVYHLASPRERTGLSKGTYYDINVESTRNVARAALATGVGRIVYAGTAVHCGINAPSPIDEHSECIPDSAHRTTKLAAERLLVSLHASSNLPVVIARLPRVFGPRCLAWVGLFQSIAAMRFRLIGSGTNWIHLGPVADIVDGLRLCAEASGVEGERFVLAGKDPVLVRDLVSMIAQELNVDLARTRLPAAPFRAFHSFAAMTYQRFGLEFPRSHRYEIFFADRRFDLSKARNQLGYHPRLSVRECIQQSAKWYREKGYLGDGGA